MLCFTFGVQWLVVHVDKRHEEGSLFLSAFSYVWLHVFATWAMGAEARTMYITTLSSCKLERDCRRPANIWLAVLLKWNELKPKSMQAIPKTEDSVEEDETHR